ncbi:MAG TPA: hypothetical protein VIG24_08595, partial [Acidimicrobiia bacterium]
MRERRAAAAGYAGRAPNGSNYPEALKRVAEWSDRFRQKIRKTDGCHEWGGTKTQQGYGVFFVAGRTLLAHRLAFVMSGGD